MSEAYALNLRGESMTRTLAEINGRQGDKGEYEGDRSDHRE
ncbi:hypothetical protein [Dactylosporangium sp. CS-033363]|jgi:hypothetical protein